MPAITAQVPDGVDQDLQNLRGGLDGSPIPKKRLDRNLLIATWNLRAFGDFTRKWRSEEGDSPKRDLGSLLYISEILSSFDVIALQEVRGNLACLRHVLKRLNHPDPHWGLILTDVNRGHRGNDERMAFVFDTRRVKLSGLAGELVVPDDQPEVHEGAFRRQFARTPYAVSFASAGKTFILVTLHAIYGDEPQRLAELRGIAAWLADWAKQVHSWDHNLIALGDFNIDRKGDALYDAFTSTGLAVPDELNAVPRSIFARTATEKFYDQIAWFTGEHGVPRLSLTYTGLAGNFDFTTRVFKELTRFEMSWRVSDHYPLWAEFSVRE